MAGLLGLLLIAYVLTRAVSDARVDHTYAKQGLVSPRLEAKYGAGARERTKRYGFVDFLADAWSDHWQRRAAALEADREAYLANPGERVRLRDRLAAAQRVMATVGRKLVEPVPTRAEREPVEVSEPQPDPDPAPVAVDTGDVPVGTVRHTDAGREQWTGSEWASAPKPSPRPRKVGERYTDEYNGRVMEWDGDAWAPVCSRCDIPMTGHDDHGWLICRRCGVRAADDRPAATTAVDTAATTGGTMSGVEASTFETAVPALVALTRAAQELAEHVAGAKAAAAQFNDQVEEIDASRQAIESAAQSVVEQFETANLDSSTMTSVTTAMEMVKAGDLSGAMDHIDAAVAKLAGAEAAAQEASGAVDQARATVESKYGDAHATVASELKGDASFLHSGGGAGGSGGGFGGAEREPVGAGVGAFAGAGEKVNVSGDAVGATRHGTTPPPPPTPSGDGSGGYNIGVVQSGSGKVNVGGNVSGASNG